MLLDWDDPLPEDDLEKSIEETSKSDLVLCLGTSLRVLPANGIPERTLKNGGKFVIVNLQNTPKDKKASLVIHYYCDYVMRQVMKNLGIKIPLYRVMKRFDLKFEQNALTMKMHPSDRLEKYIEEIEVIQVGASKNILRTKGPFETWDLSKEGKVWKEGTEVQMTIRFVGTCEPKVVTKRLTIKRGAVEMVEIQTQVIDYNEEKKPAAVDEKEPKVEDGPSTKKRKKERNVFE
jgi:hypothetical protein